MTGHQAIVRLLADRIGLDPTSVGDELIDRGVRNRMTAIGCPSIEDYQWVLDHSSVEVQALVEEVVIPESWFFRDDRPFQTLADFARDGWLNTRQTGPLRVLSIPCAGGEEPYSIAMTLVDLGLSTDRFRVDAVDVSERSVARAIAGVYGPNSFRGTGGGARHRHFREDRGRFSVDPRIRACVHFRVGNLLDPSLYSDQAPFDALFCRNVLIYLDDLACRKAFASLDRLVVDGGLLFLGHADRFDEETEPRFAKLPERGSFAYRKGAPVASNPPDPGPRPKPKGATKPAPTTEPRPAQPAGRLAPIAPREPECPHPTVEAPEAALERGSGLADLGRYVEAARIVDDVIRRGPPIARAHFLAGLIAEAIGDHRKAEAQFLKAIYLDAQHDEALLSLASLSHRKGDVAAEAAYRKRASRVAARKGNP